MYLSYCGLSCGKGRRGEKTKGMVTTDEEEEVGPNRSEEGITAKNIYEG